MTVAVRVPGVRRGPGVRRLPRARRVARTLRWPVAVLAGLYLLAAAGIVLGAAALLQ